MWSSSNSNSASARLGFFSSFQLSIIRLDQVLRSHPHQSAFTITTCIPCLVLLMDSCIPETSCHRSSVWSVGNGWPSWDWEANVQQEWRNVKTPHQWASYYSGVVMQSTLLSAWSVAFKCCSWDSVEPRNLSIMTRPRCVLLDKDSS